MKNHSWKGRGQGDVTRFRILHPRNISGAAETRDFNFFIYWLAMWSISLVMSDPLSGRGQGHVSNFYILDLENNNDL